MKIGPQFKIARRLGRIFPKTQSAKFTLAAPEKKQGGRRRSASDFGVQLIEKQKARFSYGVTEKQFANYVGKARESKAGAPADNLYRLLESRLDNVVFRLGLVGSRRFARQAVSHGHIWVNGRRVTIPSYSVKVGDAISIRPESRGNGIFRDLAERAKNHQAPQWLSFDYGKNEGTVKAQPQLGEGEKDLNFSVIIEFYSRV